MPESNAPAPTAAQPKPKNAMVQLILDFGPLAVFFLAYKNSDLITATTALIIATILTVAYGFVTTKKLAVMPVVTGVLVTVFGGLTIWLNDENFIKIKPTIINLLFALALLIGLQLKKPILKTILGQALELKDAGWYILSFRWALFFIFLAAVNELIWRNFSTDFWVSFKVFGMLTMTIVFTVSQVGLIGRYMKSAEEES